MRTLAQSADAAKIQHQVSAPGGYVPPPQYFCHGQGNTEETADPWVVDFEWSYRREMRKHVERWKRRAKERPQVALYAAHRARAIALDPFDRMATCGRRSVTIACGCEHRWVRVPVGCGLRWLCPTCQERFYKRYRKRLKRSMKAAHLAARHDWTEAGRIAGKRRDWVLVTLTVRHSGNVATDRERIVRAWKRTRQWLWRRMGRFAYALVWEFTPGTDGKGHVHAHVAALWPKFPWADLAAEWRCATDGESTRINVKRATRGPAGAAAYLAKYASKGVEVRESPPVLAARALSAFYGKRYVTASHGFWKAKRTTCTTCLEPFWCAAGPASLAQIAPDAVWRSRAALAGVEWRRGPPQKALSTGGDWARRSPRTNPQT